MPREERAMKSPENEGPLRDVWVVRAGRGGEFVDAFLGEDGEGYVAIGWSEVGRDLREFSDLESLRAAVKHGDPGATVMAVAMGAGQLWRFAHELRVGDIVLTADPVNHKVHGGELASDYRFVAGGDAQCPYEHRRDVKWTHVFDRDALSVKLKYSLQALMTLFNLGHHREEILALMGMGNGPPDDGEVSVAKLVRDTREAVLSRLGDMDGEEFEHFVRHLLEVVGFEQTEVTSYVGDQGVDVVGILNARGLASVNLKVQVKRQSGSVGVTIVNGLRGTLAYEEHGLIITTSKFTQQAIEVAETPGLKRIALLDGAGLVDLIMDVYDDLDEEYQARLGLQRVFVAGAPGPKGQK